MAAAFVFDEERKRKDHVISGAPTCYPPVDNLHILYTWCFFSFNNQVSIVARLLLFSPGALLKFSPVFGGPWPVRGSCARYPCPAA